mgnify:CR=1 FL=1|jgi:tRNA A37 threonylcarbamoyladenosine dehydratase
MPELPGIGCLVSKRGIFMDERYTRQEMLLGPEAMARLYNAHVAVFGLGGVGSYTVEALARAGIGELTLVDHDSYGLSNINRQLGALTSTLGNSKVSVMGRRVSDINPLIKVHTFEAMYTSENRELFFKHKYDYIVDAIDLVSSKLDLIITAMEREIPIISSMGMGNRLDPSKLEITDISKTSYCPLARIIRRELRKKGVFHHRVLFSSEKAIVPERNNREQPPPGRRSIPGSVSWVPSCAGLMLAGEVVLQISGFKRRDG